MNEWTVRSIKGFIAEHKNSRSSYYEIKAKDIECLLNEYNGLIDRMLEIIDNYTVFRCKGGSDVFEAVILRPHDMKNAIEALKGGRDN